jgi:hypothetical protein
MREQRADHFLIPRRASRIRREIRTDEIPGMSSPYRTGHSIGIHREDVSSLTQERRITLPRPQTDDLYDDPPRTHTSVVRYRPQPVLRRQRGFHWLFYGGVALMGITLTMMVTLIVPPFFQRWNDERVYGFPRTYQVDENVGHGTPKNPLSHFIFLNNKGEIEVIEISGDPDDLHPHLYVVTRVTGDMAASYPVTASFVDVNGDGKVDIEITVNNTLFLLYNDGTEFKQGL